MRVGFDRQVLSAENGREVGARRAPAPAFVDRELVGAEAFLLETVEILGLAKPGFAAGLDEGAEEGIARTAVGHAQRPVAAVKIAAAILVVLGALEVGEHVGERPAGETQLTPAI